MLLFHDMVNTSLLLPSSFNFQSFNWFRRALNALFWGGLLSTVETFDYAVTIFLEVKGMVSGLSSVIFISLYRAWHFYHVPIISLGSFQYCKICPKLSNEVWALEGQAGPSCLIRSIRTVCQYKKCTSSFTGVITSLTDLLQANHQGLIGTSNLNSTGSPVLPRLLRSSNPCFVLARFFFHPCHWPVHRLDTG